MSQMFKPGDLVVCVDDIDTQGKLEHGKTYKVIKSDSYFTFLEDLRDSNNGFYSGRFELVEEIPKTQLFKLGDKIRCIAGYYELTKGITYTVEDLGTGLTGNKTVKLVGVDNYWNEGRFELVEETPNTQSFKVGDVVEWCGARGIVERLDAGTSYPITVKFESGAYNSFTKNGKYYSWHKTPGLKLISRPKKRVKKTVEAWANVYAHCLPDLFNCEANADARASNSRIACVKLTGEYEVEEDVL